MRKKIKFTKAKIDNLLHPDGKREDKWYDLTCEGLVVFVQPQPSLTKSYYANWSTIAYSKDGKQKRSGRYKYICRVGQRTYEDVKQEVNTKLPIWRAGNITSSSVKTVGSLVQEYIKYGAGGFRVRSRRLTLHNTLLS